MLDPYLPCDVPRQSGGSTQIPSLTGSAKPVFRDAHDRRHFSPKPNFRFDNSVPNRLLEQTRLSILSWNPGRRRGRDGAIEEHIAGAMARDCAPGCDRVPPARVPHGSLLHYPRRWLCCLVQQGHFSLEHQFQVHLPPRHKKWATSSREEGQSGWVLQAVISRRSEGFRVMASPTLP